MARNNIFSGDNHDVETWLDFFIKQHLTSGGDNYTISHYWEHFHAPIAPLVLPVDNYLFIKKMISISLDEDIKSIISFINEDNDTWAFLSPAVAVRANGVIIYSTYDILTDNIFKEMDFVHVNVHFMQLYGYLITVKT